MRAILPALVLLAAATPAMHAGEAKPPAAPKAAPSRPERKLSLGETVELALRHNLVLAAEKINPQRAHAVVVEQQAIFDPTAYSELTRAKSKTQQTSVLIPQRIEAAQGTLGVAKLLPPGTVVDVHAGGAREWGDGTSFTDINPAYKEEWGITISQPLLRGFGVRVNTAGIATARNERLIAQAQLRSVAHETVAAATQGFWRLVFAIRDRALIQQSLERAVNLQKDIQARVDAKVLGERDPAVAQARAEVAVRQEEIVVADQAIHNAEDALKVITDLAADPAVWAVALIPTTEPPTTVPPLDPDKAVEVALARRPEQRQAQLAIDNRDILILVRGNEIKPRLDLNCGFGNSGLNTSWNNADHDLRSLDYYQWSVGVTFEYPLGNRAARSRYRRARLEHEQARLSLRTLESQINLEVRNAVRAVATSGEHIRAAAVSIEAERERLRAEEIRYKDARVGTIQDVLDAQAALAEAERRQLRSVIDLNISHVEVERVRGTILEANDVTWEDD